MPTKTRNLTFAQKNNVPKGYVTLEKGFNEIHNFVTDLYKNN
jgi:hypothetical protein